MITRITDGLRLSEKHNFIRKLSYIIYGVPLGSSVTKHCTLITWKIEFKKGLALSRGMKSYACKSKKKNESKISRTFDIHPGEKRLGTKKRHNLFVVK